MCGYSGGCHCGAVRFRIDLKAPIAALIACDCSICTKKGVLNVGVEPDALTILAGGDNLETYRFHSRVAEHNFCKRCGIHVYSKPRNNPGRFAVNARCLDDFHEISARATVTAFDGRNHPKDQPAPNAERQI